MHGIELSFSFYLSPIKWEVANVRVSKTSVNRTYTKDKRLLTYPSRCECMPRLIFPGLNGRNQIIFVRHLVKIMWIQKNSTISRFSRA
ncbi:hypothetical protein FJTKL_07036 [Diaporthe vaccinii]|uniref:Uncharacterized protein n=1 Tax=Diaporthe vaccinii TaxID=105482 RepID=A0ABR4EUV8_9PEZI